MRTKAVSLVLIFLASLLGGLVQAQTPDAVIVDGDFVDWPADTLMQTDSNGVDFRLTWNESHLFLGWEGTDWKADFEGADLFVYLNTTQGGSVLARDWGFAHTLPFAADHGFVLEDDTYNQHISHDGSSWVDRSTEVDLYAGWADNKVTELALPWAALDAPTSFDIVVYAQWQDEGHVWASFPTTNPASNNGAETFTHYWHAENVSNATSPQQLPIVQGGGIDKVSDALNLAIVFHQHQPYYKNKLTGMYEMPWVRVHAMTEYVDSPGILATTDTKVTYNLVPSFIEQLVDYNQNETLDVHTDIAQRSWTVGGYPNATDLELHTMQFQSFWNSGWIYNVSQTDPNLGWLYPSSARYKELYDMTLHNLKPDTIMDDELLAPQDFLDLQVLWYLYQFSPDYVEGDYNLSHRDEGLIDLFKQGGNFDLSDLNYVLDAQHQHMGNVLPMYSELAASGQVELTTTPYYHPIMPLLMMDGWTMEDGIRVNKDAWPVDVQNHLVTGMNLFESELGFRPVGMWPSEQAVSPAMVQPVSDVGVQWMVSDEDILKQSTDANGQLIDVEDASNLATPWKVTGADGGEVSVIFRDRVISDRIAFQYGTMTPEAAVSDFIAYLDNIRQQLLDAGEDPSEHLLTVALDGENWMFMSEFQHHDNARPFMAEWYNRLAEHPTVVTTTPSEFLTASPSLPEIETIGTGSWIDGTLRTWAGEEEESLGWQRLVEARQALVAFESSNPNDPGLPAAWESLYIAEGSDWYWWYGLDQDSGYDENWDVLFKVHLSNIYRAINLDLPPYLQDLWTNPAVPNPAASSIIEPMIDGVALPGEWDGAARYDAPVSGGDFDIESFYFGYDASNVFVRVDAANLASLEAADTTTFSSPDLAIYFMQPNAVNFNEAETNFRTYYGNQILGFPSKYMVAFDFDTVRDDGRAKWNLFTASGKVGDEERWVLSSSSNLGGCAVDDVYEFAVPWGDLGLSPRYSTRVKVVTSWRDSLSYGDGMDAEMAPPAPAEMVLPDLEEWVTLLELEDAVGDETGDGDYVYPLATDFNTPSGGGLWDATHLTVRQSAWNAQFILTMSEMTDIWGLANGFSHQIVQIYVDQGPTEYGRVSMLTGANAEVHPDWAWEVAISGTGEPGAVQAVQAQTGSTSARGVDVSGDVEAKTITFTVSKDVIGSDIPNYRFVIVIGSQDGFGTGKWRDVMEQPATWVLGGGENPAPDDGLDYDPNIIDVILDGDGQSTMLSSYNVAGHTYAQLTGFEMPEVPQQIFGASVDTVSSSSAVLTWSTTVADATSIVVTPSGQEPTSSDRKTWTLAGTDHAVTLSDLASNTSYWAHISANGTEDVVVWFNTSSVVDETPPEILNLAVEVLESGSVIVSWYTSESSTERLLLNGEVLHEDLFATKKNHAFTTAPLDEGTYDLEVLSADASGNTNTSQLSFAIADGGAVVSEEARESTNEAGEEDDASNDVSPLMIQFAGILVVVLVLLALVRIRGSGPDENDPWK